MVIITKNPYVEELHEAHRKGDKDAVRRINELSRAFIYGLIEKTSDDYCRLQPEITGVDSFPSARKQYQEACRLYKKADQLVKDLRFVKSELRRELKFGKFRGDSQ